MRYIFGRAPEGLAALRQTGPELLNRLAPIEQFAYFNALAFNAPGVNSGTDGTLLQESIRAYARALALARSMAMPLLVVRMTINIAVLWTALTRRCIAPRNVAGIASCRPELARPVRVVLASYPVCAVLYRLHIRSTRTCWKKSPAGRKI